MKMEKQLFKHFFIPFLIGVILSIVIVINNSWNFTGDYFDKKTGKNIIDLIKDFSKININSINDIISTHLLKIQLSLFFDR